MLVEVDPLPKVRARAGGLRWLGANESLQPACDTCGQIPKLAHARGVACPLCHVGCTLERDQLVALSTGASREALLSGGALLPRGVFAQSRNTRLLASGMCSERAAFIHCLAPKQTDRYHRTKACRATCLHPRYEVHHPAKTFAPGVKLDQVTRYPLSPPILACGATLSCWLPLSRASKSFLFRRRASAMATVVSDHDRRKVMQIVNGPPELPHERDVVERRLAPLVEPCRCGPCRCGRLLRCG